jgi:hypothetical protein
LKAADEIQKRRPPDLHGSHEDRPQGQLEYPFALEKQRIAAGLGDDERSCRHTKGEEPDK